MIIVFVKLQKSGQQMYSGTWNALTNIIRQEGFSALYKGFWVNTMQFVASFGYILTYEKVRDMLAKNDIHDNRIRGLISGGCGSLVSQTIICPFDVISQHLMLNKSKTISTTLNIDPDSIKRYGMTKSVIKELYRVDGGLRVRFP